MEKIDYYINELTTLFVAYAPKVLLALLTLLIGLWVIKSITRLTDKAMEKREVDVSLRNFLSSLVSIILKALLVLSVISMVGIETISFVAILAAAGFAIGMALQGSLGNFAGGVLILIFKPYKVGDYIEAQGFAGAVNSIQVFNTILKTPDNKTIIIPNGAMSSGPITNYSTEPTRRVDFVFGIGYGDDIQKAREIIDGIIKADSRILKEPEPAILVGELADSSVNFTVRVWANATDYWGIYFDMQEKVKLEFDKQGVSIPFPQTDVHVINQ